MRRLWVMFVAVLIAAPGLTWAGQQADPATDRGALLAAERDKRVEETAAPERSLVERALYWYDNQYVLPKIASGWNGVRLAGDASPLAQARRPASRSIAHHPRG